MINWFQSNFLLNLSCHHELADGEHQKEDFAQADFLLGYHQGASQARSSRAGKWPERSHLVPLFPPPVPQGQQGSPIPAALDHCLQPARDFKGSRWFGGRSALLSERDGAGSPWGVFRLLARCEHLEENVKKGLLACAAEDCGSVC